MNEKVAELVERSRKLDVKHARRVLDDHPYYNAFTDFGDAESYRGELPRLREELSKLGR